jgi:hypothetical protein
MGTMDRETQQNYTLRFLIRTFGYLPEPGMQNALLACACYCACHVRRAWYLPHMCAKISATPEGPGNTVPVTGNGKRVLEGKETSGRSCLDVTVIVAEVVMWGCCTRQ